MNRPVSASLITYVVICGLFLMAGGVSPAHAQVLIANEDNYGVPYGETLIVEPLGVLDNDLLDGEGNAVGNGIYFARLTVN